MAKRRYSKVTGTNFAKKMQKILSQYGDEIIDEVSETIPKIAEETVEDIKDNAIKLFDGNEYANDWEIDHVDTSRISTKTIIRSKDHYRLAHLLEKGHAKVNGGRVEGRPHIKPAEDKAVKKLEDKIQEVIKNASK